MSLSPLRKLAWLLPLLAAAAPAQPRVEVQVNNDRPYVDEPVLVQVLVYNFEQTDGPVWPELANATLRNLGPGSDASHTTIVNGRVTQSRWRSYSAEITPHRAGELLLPAVQVIADGRTLETRPVRIQVRADDGVQPVFAEVEIPGTRLFVGQQVKATLRIWVLPPPVGQSRLGPSDVYARLDRRNSGFGRFPPATAYTERTRADAAGDSSSFYVFESAAEVILDHPGRPEFDDVFIGMNYPTRFRRDIFGDLEVLEFRSVRARPEVKAADVEPLPSEGRPASFAGAVGRFSLHASASPPDVRVGDPIELTLEIRGDGPIATLPAPPLAAQPALQADFRVPQETLTGTFVNGRRRFTTTLRAKRADVRAVPPIEFAYFDPQAARYVVARSEPAPLRVTASETVALSEMEGAVAPPVETAAAAAELREGLRGNETRVERVLSSVSAVRLTHVVAAAGAPPLLFAIAWVGLSVQRSAGKDSARRRQQAALARARQRLTSAGHKDAAGVVQQAVAGYLADRLNQPAARFAGHSAIQELPRGAVPNELLLRLEQLLRDCEAAAYGGGPPAADLTQAAHECLAQLERCKL